MTVIDIEAENLANRTIDAVAYGTPSQVTAAWNAYSMEARRAQTETLESLVDALADRIGGQS